GPVLVGVLGKGRPSGDQGGRQRQGCQRLVEFHCVLLLRTAHPVPESAGFPVIYAFGVMGGLLPARWLAPSQGTMLHIWMHGSSICNFHCFQDDSGIFLFPCGVIGPARPGPKPLDAITSKKLTMA